MINIKTVKKISYALLALIPFLVLTSIANGTNNTSSIYDNISSVYNNSTSTTYRVFVDEYRGFYRLYNANTGKEMSYENDTLNLHTGDTVIWSNEDSVATLTIVSNPKLWDDKKAYIRPYQRFSYTFNKSGTYDIYVRQRQTLPHQKIIVYSLNNTDLSKDTLDNDVPEDNIDIREITTSEKRPTDNNESSKSRISIKTYRRPKGIPGFEIMLTISATILTFATYYLKRKRKNQK